MQSGSVRTITPRSKPAQTVTYMTAFITASVAQRAIANVAPRRAPNVVVATSGPELTEVAAAR